MRKKLSVRALCEGALLVALAQGLGYVKFAQMPLGGSVTLAMLPIVVFAVRWGWQAGLLAGFAFGLLQLTLDGAYAWGWQSMIGDYLLAFTPLGLAGLFRGKKWGLVWGLLLGALCRFGVHYVVGATVWASSTPENFASPWVYSLAYNGAYMGLSTLICLVAAILLRKLWDLLPKPE